MAQPAVLVIAYNRPHYLKMVLDSIAEFGGSRVTYICLDGARTVHDESAVTQCRELCEDFARDRRARLLFQDTNLGVKHGPISALNWFFGNESAGLILEDDCQPCAHFFPYCDILLEKYRDDRHVGIISGFRNAPDKAGSRLTYSLARSIGIWGWATWRDRWEDYDPNMSTWPALKRSRRPSWRASSTPGSGIFWRDMLDAAFRGQIPTWDYQLVYSLWRKQRLACIPSHSLIYNLDSKDRFMRRVLEREITESPNQVMTVTGPVKDNYDSFVDRNVHRAGTYPFRKIWSSLMSRMGT